ncbi:putative uncharacterized protein [Clostridium sp. CAG:149]|nr:putative uncharacterized protein [Clostridium sp. CAG:149]
MKTKQERNADHFRIELESLKIIKNWTDEDLAKRLGISLPTVRRMRAEPYSAKGGYILEIQGMLREAKKDM